MRHHAGAGGNFRICYHPLMSGIDSRDEFDGVCRLVTLARETVFVADEVWIQCTSGWCPESLRQIIFAGRHSGTTFLYTAQMPQKVATDIRGQTTRVNLFRVSRRQFYSIKVDFDADESLAAVVTSLPNRKCMIRDEAMQWHKM